MLVRAALVPPDTLVAELDTLAERMAQLPGVRRAPKDGLEVPVVALDHLEVAGVRRLIAELEPAMAAVPAPAVHCAGVRLLPAANGTRVAVNLAGDVAGVNQLARAIGEVLASLSIYPDRPVFHPCVVLAHVPDRLPGSVGGVERLVEHWLGSSWSMRELCVAQTTAGGLSGAAPTSKPLAWLPVGSRVPTA